MYEKNDILNILSHYLKPEVLVPITVNDYIFFICYQYFTILIR